LSDFESWASEEIVQFRQGTQRRCPSPYQSLFRYVGLNNKTSWEMLERTLQKSELLGATAHSLNDPYELSPVRFDDLSARTIPRPPSFHALSGTPPEKKIDEKARVETARSNAHEFLDGKIKAARIIAFCQQSQSPLLWSHYANSYKGACLHFLARAFTHRSPGIVTYSKSRPIYPLSLAAALFRQGGPSRPPVEIDRVLQSESDQLLFFTKSEDWSYECEVRLVFDSRRETYIQFNPDALASIIIGPRMPTEDEARLRDIVRRSPVSELPIRKARLSSTTFSVEMDDAAEIRPA